MLKIRAVMIVALFLTISSGAGARPLELQNQLGMRFGVCGLPGTRTEVAVGPVFTSAGGGGFVGSVYYSKWLSESFAIHVDLQALMIAASTEAGGFEISSSMSTVSSVLLGVTVFFLSSTYGHTVWPYACAAVGAYIGHQSGTMIRTAVDVTTQSRTETAFGGQIGVGVGFILGSHAMAEVSLGYNLMSDFNRPHDGSVHCSGPQVSFGFSYIYGGDSKQQKEDNCKSGSLGGDS